MKKERRLRLRVAGSAVGLTGLVTGLLSVVGAVAAPAAGAATGSVITIGYISDLTGVAASTFQDGAGGAQARVAAQNAAGGVNGHKLKLVVEDDQSSPTVNNTASQDLVQNKGAFGVVQLGAFAFGGYKYLQQQGVPVTGLAFDGPEWAAQPNSNMFSANPPLNAPIGNPPVYYGSTAAAKVFKALGATKIAGLGYAISQSSKQSIRATFAAAEAVGGVSNCYQNYSVPFGGVDFTAAVLQIKTSGCNGVVGSFVDSSDIALSQAVKNAGLKATQIYFTGYDQQVLDSPTASAALDGAYMQAGINFTTPNAAVKKMIATVKKYDTAYTGGIMDLGLYGSYVATDLMIKGLQLSGKNPTPAGFIAKLRKLKSYDAGGIFASPVTMTGFGTPKMVPKSICYYFMQLKNGQFSPYTGKAVCGKRIVAPSS